MQSPERRGVEKDALEYPNQFDPPTRMDSAATDHSTSHPDATANRSVEEIVRLADICVKCGLCLPHCPTYGISGLEGESPRGRIALMQGLALDRLPAGGRTALHLETCTECRNCETVCPAKVPYGELIDLGRAELRRRGHPRNLGIRLLKSMTRRPRLSRALLSLLRWSRRLGARRLGPMIGLGPRTFIGRILLRLPATSPDRGLAHRRGGGATGDPVMLFTGCVSSALDRQTLYDAADVLSRCGYRTEIPRDQVCCGALDLHDGDPETAIELAGANLEAFGNGEAPILTLASGCAATLDEYGRLAGARGAAFRLRIDDLGTFLQERWTGSFPDLGAIDARAALFEPCTARNNPWRQDRNADLLRRIPGLELDILRPGFGCCGAAGHHFVTRPDQADALAAPILEQIIALDPDYLVVSNVGCALHLAGALQSADGRATVMHPVSLLIRSLNAGD
jgi:glycolate oxidase iron-sulfur subunit